MILNLNEAPKDPIERIAWLSGVKEAVEEELDLAFASAYFRARLESRFDAAVLAGPYAKKRALRLTRQENERHGRTVRWNDGLDPTSTAFKG